jgi:hypothetical protein
MFTDILASNLTGQNKPKWHLSPEDLKGWSQNRIRWNGMKGTVTEKEGGNTPCGQREKIFLAVFFLIPNLPRFSSRDSHGWVALLLVLETTDAVQLISDPEVSNSLRKPGIV